MSELSQSGYVKMDASYTGWNNLKCADLFQMIAASFFCISAGMYGFEYFLSIVSAPIILITIYLYLILFELPIALISIQALSMFPKNGNCQMIRVALGDTIANHCSYWSWVCNLTDCCIFTQLTLLCIQKYIPVVPIYISSSMTINIPPNTLIGYPIITIIALLNLLDCALISIINQLVFIIVFISCILFVLIGWQHTNISTISEYEQASLTDFSLIFSWIIWINSGLLFVTITTRQFASPKKIFALTSFIVLPSAVIINCLMIVVSLSIDSNKTNYQNSAHFSYIAYIISGRWFEYVFEISCIITLLARFYNKSVIAKECLSDLISCNFQHLIPNKSIKTKLSAVGSFGSLGSLLSCGTTIDIDEKVKKVNEIEDESTTIPQPMYRHKRFSITGTTPLDTPPSQKVTLYTNKIMNTPADDADIIHLTDLTESKSTTTSKSPRKLLSSRLNTQSNVPSIKHIYCINVLQVILFHRNKLYVLLNYILTLVIYSLVDYNILIQFESLLVISIAMLTVYSFFRLKLKHESQEMTVSVNTQMRFILLTIGPYLLCIGHFIFTFVSPYHRLCKLVMYSCTLLIGIIIQLVWKLCTKLFEKRKPIS